MKTAEITNWVTHFLESLADEALYLVDINWSNKSQKLEVFIESDQDLTLGDVQKISREMQQALEESDILGESYRLDVSSPGVDRPLKLRRQYGKNIGRVVAVELVTGSILIGKLKSIDEAGIFVEPEIPGHKSKKATYEEERRINWEEIKQTIVQVRF